MLRRVLPATLRTADRGSHCFPAPAQKGHQVRRLDVPVLEDGQGHDCQRVAGWRRAKLRPDEAEHN